MILRAHLCARCWAVNVPEREPITVLARDLDPCSCCGGAGDSIYRRMQTDELERWRFRVESTKALRDDPVRDPFVGGVVPAKSLFRLVPSRSGTVRSLWCKPMPESEAFHARILPFAVVRGEPSEILAPGGWGVAAMLEENNGQRWAVPFAEVQPEPKTESR